MDEQTISNIQVLVAFTLVHCGFKQKHVALLLAI